MRRLLHHSILVTSLLLPIVTVAAGGGSCAIESSMSPGLSEYRKTVNTTLNTIEQFSNKNNACKGNNNGNFSNEKKGIEVLNKIDAQENVSYNVVQDFQYMVTLAANGESISPVMRDGEIFRQIEVQIQNALKKAVNTCTLDTPLNGGVSIKDTLGQLLQHNRKVEDYYKSVALGNPVPPSDMSPADSELYADLAGYYSKEATKACKNQYDFETLQATFMSGVVQAGKKAEKGLTNWKEAIDLFAGRNTSSTKYKELQTRLMTAELARQGVSSSAKDMMLSRLTCVQNKTQKDSTVEDTANANFDCLKETKMILGADSLMKTLEKSVIRATNIDQYLAKTLAYSKTKDTYQDDMANVWQNITTLLNQPGEEDINTKTMTDLYNLHVQLVNINEIFQKQIPLMQKTCMKGNPSVEGGCRVPY